MTDRRGGFAVLAGSITITVVLLGAAGAGAAGPAADHLLSRNKPVTASSSGGCCAPKNAVDGNSSTRWASGSGNDPQWIYVDLGATVNVHRVRLQWDASCATAYQVQTSPDHATWTTVSTVTAGDGGVDDLNVDGSGRYVRMYGTHRCRSDSSHGYSLREFDVYGTTGSGPTSPTNVHLISVTPNTVTIGWDPATDDVGVVAYDMFHDGQLCATVSGDTFQATCTGLSPRVMYGFYVDARDGDGNVSQSSDTLQVTTPDSDDHEPPTVPGNLHANISGTSATLTWDPSTDNVGVAGYRVYDGTTPVATTTDTSATITGLTLGKTYHFTVTAFDANGNESAQSDPVTVIPNPEPCQVAICTVTQIATDNDVVWGLVTLPDGTILYNRRDAHNIVRLDPRTGAKTTVGTVPNVQSTDGEGGLTGLEINPRTFATDRWLYIMHTSPSDNRIVRIKLTTSFTLDVGSEQVLVTGIARNKYHNGGRLRFSPDGRYLFAGTGDAQNDNNAQNKNSLNGKVLRINPDGSIPSDNPFGNAVWSYGHRNVQGLAFDSHGQLWEQEFGNSVMDETNLITKGGNYGWPKCEGTSGSCGTAGFIAPKATYSTSAGSCSGITIVRDYLYVACQKGQRLYVFQIVGDTLVKREQYLQGTYGRLRTVEPAPDGGMWLATSNGGDKDSTPNNSDNRIFHVTLGH
jgi:glucose/arabinose dehydrogenase